MVTEEYCTYIKSNFEKYEVILQALKDQFTSLECQGALYMKCNGSLKLSISPTIFLVAYLINKLFRL